MGFSTLIVALCLTPWAQGRPPEYPRPGNLVRVLTDLEDRTVRDWSPQVRPPFIAWSEQPLHERDWAVIDRALIVSNDLLPGPPLPFATLWFAEDLDHQRRMLDEASDHRNN